MSERNKNCAIKWKNNGYYKEYVRSRDTIQLTHLNIGGYYSQFAFFIHMHIIVIVMVVIITMTIISI